MNNKINEIETKMKRTKGTDGAFMAEGAACLAWRDAVWRKCYSILDEVTAGSRPVPTEEELLTELPKLNWGTID